jgi:hypothetical protein
MPPTRAAGKRQRMNPILMELRTCAQRARLPLS